MEDFFMKNKYLLILLTLLVLISGCSISWAITCSILYLGSLCFGLSFSLKIATGLWLILILILAFIKQNHKKEP